MSTLFISCALSLITDSERSSGMKRGQKYKRDCRCNVSNDPLNDVIIRRIGQWDRQFAVNIPEWKERNENGIEEGCPSLLVADYLLRDAAGVFLDATKGGSEHSYILCWKKTWIRVILQRHDLFCACSNIKNYHASSLVPYLGSKLGCVSWKSHEISRKDQKT